MPATLVDNAHIVGVKLELGNMQYSAKGLGMLCFFNTNFVVNIHFGNSALLSVQIHWRFSIISFQKTTSDHKAAADCELFSA